MLVISGPVFLLGGVIMKVWPPKEIHMLYGYRNPLSGGYSEKLLLIELII